VDDEKLNWPSSRLKVGRNVTSIVATIHPSPKLFDILYLLDSNVVDPDP
jgi:hypothetical protein